MPEVQKTVQTGEMTQRFIEFVMMHAQNAALFLGQIPNPKTGEAEINLDLARMFIDQLEMIQEKTRGNLTNEEMTVLRNALSNLQMAFVEASGATQPQRAPQPEARTAHLRTTDGTIDLKRSRAIYHLSRQLSPRQNRERNSPKATGHSSIQLRKLSRGVSSAASKVCARLRIRPGIPYSESCCTVSDDGPFPATLAFSKPGMHCSKRVITAYLRGC